MVVAKTFDVTQMQEAKATTPVPLALRQPQQPLGDLGVLSIELGLIATSALTQPKYLTRQTDNQPLLFNCPSGHLASARWH